MTSRLSAFCFDARDPALLEGFWSALLAGDESGLRLRFVQNDEPKAGPNQFHFDITSRSLEHQQETVARVLELGGSHLDIGQGPDVEHVVMADPEGNELCVVEPGNGFLADCPFIGALSGDGSQACGYFWSAALGWPLVWDQDEETAIRSPDGGPKVTWGGPPYKEKLGKEHVHLELAPVDGDLAAEVQRLLSLGATRVDIGQGDVGWVVLADPDGHEFCVQG